MKSHEAVQHIGHPDVFNFEYVYMDIAQFCVCWKCDFGWYASVLQSVKTCSSLLPGEADSPARIDV